MKAIRSALLALVAVAVSLAIAWWSADPDQRRQALSWLMNPRAPVVSPIPRAPPPQAPRSQPLVEAVPYTRLSEPSGGRACIWRQVPNPSKNRRSEIYRWTDENGQVHFTDRPSEQQSWQALEGFHVDGESRFSLEIVFHGLRELPGFRDAIDAGTQRIYRFLEQQLRQGGLAPLHVKLSIVRGEKRFDSIRQKLAPSVRTTSGFYQFRKNLAVVREYKRDLQRTLAVSRHEVSHLVLGNLFGDTDTWLNEGLAEFFERVNITGRAAVVEFDDRYRDRLLKGMRKKKLPGVGWLLRSSYKQWKSRDLNLMYDYSWSLIHHLMSTDSGERFLGELLREQRRRRCSGFSTATFVAEHYPGGHAGLQKDWRRWMLERGDKSLYF